MQAGVRRLSTGRRSSGRPISSGSCSSRRRFAWTAGTIGIGLGALYVVLAGVAPDLMGTQRHRLDVARVRRRRRPHRPHVGDHARLHAALRSRVGTARGADPRAVRTPSPRRATGRFVRGTASACPRARRSRDDRPRHRRGRQRARPRRLRDRPRDHAADHVLGVQADAHRDRVLGRQPRHLRPAERLRDRGRLPVGVDVPRLRRADLPVRRRRLGRARRRRRVVPARRAAARRADAQLRPVHDGRRARPSGCASGRRGSSRRSARSSSRSST